MSETRTITTCDASVWCAATQFADGSICRGDADISPPTVHLDGTYEGLSPSQARQLAHEICFAAAVAGRWAGEIPDPHPHRHLGVDIDDRENWSF